MVSSNLKGSGLKVCSAAWVLVTVGGVRLTKITRHIVSLHSVLDSYSPYAGSVLIILAVVSLVCKTLLRIPAVKEPRPHALTGSVASARYSASSLRNILILEVMVFHKK